jgi:hypothetical protein
LSTYFLSGAKMTHQIAQRVINKLGGTRAVSLMLGISTQAIYKWMRPFHENGTGGFIPHRRQIELMVAARQRGIILTPEDFFPKGSNGTPIQSSSQGAENIR